MTSISAAGSGYLSPLQQLQKELQSEVAAGEISSADQDALTDIDASLQGGRSSGSSSKTASPDNLMAKIDDLIAAEVSSGKLTSDQGAELKEVFENAFSKAGPDRPSGPPPPGDSSSSSEDSSSSTNASSTAELLQEFIKTLQESTSASSASYSESGDTSSSKSASALLIDYES